MISIERAGYGVSTAQPGRRFIDIVPDVRALADHLGLDAFAVVGWSTGGPHALATASGLADRVRAVGAVASIAPLDKVGLDGFGERAFIEMTADPVSLREGMKQLAAAMRDDPAGTATALLGEMLSEGDMAWLGRPENFEMMLADMAESARGDWEGYADDCIADAGEWGFQLDEVKTRVALLHGTTDGVVPIEHSRYLKQALPNASLREVDGEGHISVLDHLPQLCAELIT